MAMGRPCIVFDFDGTLVDSAPGILSAMTKVLAASGIMPQVALQPGIVGPPLRDTLQRVSGLSDAKSLDALAITFKANYDETGYRNTLPYPGIAQALRQFVQHGCQLEIVTNKRGIPTRKILEHFGWTSFFAGIHPLDEYKDCADKSSLLSRLITEGRFKAASTPYIGDTAADARAAAVNGMPFLRAAWGYGHGDVGFEGCVSCANADEMSVSVLNLIGRLPTCAAH